MNSKSKKLPLAEVKDLNITFNSETGNNHVLKGVSFKIFNNQTVALVGESGSGKSVSARTLMKLLPRTAIYSKDSQVHFKDQDIQATSEDNMQKLRGNKISMIFQEPMTSLNPLFKVGHQLLEGIMWHHPKMNKAEAKSKIIDLFDLVSLPNPENMYERYPHELSGGQRQRVMIALALLNDSELLIADEPTTALDVTVQAQILKLLRELQTKLNMGMLLITHDLTIVEKFADYVYVMSNGEIVEQNTTKEIFSNAQHPYTQKLLNSKPVDYAPPLNKKTMVVFEGKNMNVEFSSKGKAKNFFFREKVLTKAVNNISIAVNQGETLGLVGESGSGKTTLAMAMLKLLENGKISGNILWDDVDISNFSRKEMKPFRKQIQVVFQDPFSSLNPRLSVKQIIEEGLIIHNMGENADERDELICKALIDSGMTADIRFRFPHEFSGGQRQRIAIARAIALDPDFIVLDEPTSALDLTVQKQIIDLLLTLQRKRNLSYIFISHDLRVVRALCHNILVIRHGDFIEYDTAHNILENPQEEYTKRLINSAFHIE